MNARGKPSPLRVAALKVYKRLPMRLSHRIVHAMQPTFSVGAVAIIEYEGRVLALRQLHRKGWSLPGGLIDAGEQPRDAVIREVWEETGLRIEPGGVMAAYFVPDIRHVDVMFRVHCDHQPEVQVSSEALEAGWFALDELPEPDESTQRIQHAVKMARVDPIPGFLIADAPESDHPGP